MTPRPKKTDIDFRDRNAVEHFLESKQFRPCSKLVCLPIPPPQPQPMLYMPACKEGRFAKKGIAKDIGMPPAGQAISPTTYMCIPAWAPLVSCPSDCRGFQSKATGWLRVWLGALFRMLKGKSTTTGQPPAQPQASSDSGTRWWIAAIIIPIIVAVLGWMTPEGRRWLHLDPAKPEPTTPAPSAQSNPPPNNSSQSTLPDKPPTLRDLFKTDFGNTMKVTDDSCAMEWKNGTKTPFTCQAYLDFPGRDEFVGFYIPSSPRTFDVSIGLQNAVLDVLKKVPQHVRLTAGYRDEATSLKDLVFTGRVLLYHEDFLTIPQKAAIIEAYRKRKMDVNFRGPDYLGDQVIAWHHQHDTKLSKQSSMPSQSSQSSLPNHN